MAQKNGGKTRRELLELGALSVLAAAGCGLGKDGVDDTGDSGAEFRADAPAVMEADGTADEALFPLGIQAGDPAVDGAVCWTRYFGETELQLNVFAWDGARWTEAGVWSVAPSEAGFVHAIPTELLSDTWYCFYFSDADEKRSSVGRFRTPPADGQPIVAFGGVSCTSQNYRPFKTLSRGAELGLDFVFLAGDQVYTDYAKNLEGKRQVWATNLTSRGYRDLLSSAAVIATWDDHEVENNWGTDPTDPLIIEAGKTAFREHTPLRVGAEEPIYRRLKWADTLEIFVLDGRSERDLSRGEYMSQTQIDWLLEAVQSSTAVFKLILNSVPFADFSALLSTIQEEDRWSGFPKSRNAVLEGLQGISNVYFVSGDFHMALVCHVEASGPGWDIYDVMVGPGGQFLNPAAELMAPNPQFPLGISENNFTRFVANPRNETLSVEYLSGEGEILASIVLPEAS